ncbi:MAG: hypothetical protein QXL43_05415 [Methanolinea sp.]
MTGEDEPEEKDMEIIKDRDLGQSPLDERVAALERKAREIEALVKGLTEELLDLKSVVMKLSKASEERARAEMKLTRPVQGGQGQPQAPIIVPQKNRPQVSIQKPVQVQAQQAAQPETEKTEMIMQLDGQLRPEKRKNSDYIIASAGFSKKKQNVPGSGKKNDLIVAEEEECERPEKK